MTQTNAYAGPVFKPDFGIFHDVSDDSYQKGYADGNAAGQLSGYAEGQQAGYAEGRLSGYAEGQLSGYAEGQLSGYAEGQLSGLAHGKQAEYDRFWDAFQQNGNRIHYSFAFGSGWTAELFKPKYPVRPVIARYLIYSYAPGNTADFIDIPDFAQFCRENNVVLDFSECTNAEYALYSLKTKRFGVLDFSNCTNLNNLFWADGGPETVDEFIASEITGFSTASFQFATNLTNITIGGIVGKSIYFNACSKLTNESAQSVIDHLADLTGKTAQTLTFHADVGAGLTEAQKATVTAKNWTLVY